MKTVFVFDLGGVLIKLNVGRCMRAFEALMGEQNMRAILGMDANGEGVKSDFEKGLISPDEFISDVQQYCHHGTTEQDIIDAWMAMLDELPEERLLFIDALRAEGHPVYLLSNGNDLHFDFINRTYGLDRHFDGLFLSQKMHLSKPEPEIFLSVNAAINQKSTITNQQSPIIFIDDIAANRLAAEQTVHWRTFSSIDELKHHIIKE